MSERAVVAGVGMIPFTKVGQSDPFDVMGAEAARRALVDAGLEYAAIQRAYTSYIYGDSTGGQKALYRLARTGVPIINVHNNCSSGSTGLMLAREAVESGLVDVALAVGFEQMVPQAEGRFPELPHPLDEFAGAVVAKMGMPESPAGAALFYGAAATQYIDEYGIDPNTLAHISVKNRKHAAANPNAVFRREVTLDEVVGSRNIYGPLTKLQCCPPTCGAAAAVLVSEKYARRHGVRRDVVIAAQAMTTDFADVFDGDMLKLVGYDMTAAGAKAVYEQSGIGPEDVRVAEVHDCFTAHELLIYEAMALTPAGTAEKFIREGQNTYGGRIVVNPSGGLIGRGHPIGATGLAQCFELVTQLRGQAGGRQVDDVSTALQHNMGMGSALVTTMYQKVDA